MEYRQLGKSDVRVSVVGFGAWAIGGFLWGGSDEEAAVAAVRAAIDCGVTTVDTAPVYGLGLSERLVGRAISGRRDQVQVLTKFGLAWEGDGGTFHFEAPDPSGQVVKVYRWASRERVIAECEDSLQRLNVDCIDLYQQHWPDPATPLEETCEALRTLLDQGKIRAVGVSNFSVEQVQHIRTLLPLASVQSPFSMVKRGMESDLLPYCLKEEIGMIAYSPLQRGLLTGKVSPDREFPPSDSRRSDPFFSPANRSRVLDLLDKFKPIAETHGATLAQLVVAWTIQRPGMTMALVGARDPDQAEENARAAEIRLTDDERTQIDGILSGFTPE
jgi:aryl-alcohol dehydrogenase-like predicted oxidoreductase